MINTHICIQTQLFERRFALIYTFFFSLEMLRIYRGVEQRQI